MRGCLSPTRQATESGRHSDYATTRQPKATSQRLQAKGYSVSKEVSEIASGLRDHRPKLARLLTDPTIGTLIVEHRDRLTRFGYEYIRPLLETPGRHLEVLFPAET